MKFSICLASCLNGPPPLSLEHEGHITARSDRRESSYGSDDDRLLFLWVPGQTMERFDGSILVYCLMDNHYHVVPYTKRANLSGLMRHLNGVYTQAYKLEHGLVELTCPHPTCQSK